MGIVVSYTCLRDIELLKELNKQLTHWGYEHWAFFEEREMVEASFRYRGKIYSRNNGGDNGMGRDGAYAKMNMLKKAYDILESLGKNPCTILDCDSDVRFKEDIIKEFECKPHEFKGFSGFNLQSTEPEPPTHRVFSDPWYYATGCVKSFNTEFIRWLKDIKDYDDFFADLINHSITPSEDAFLSYVHQVKFRGTFVNMKEKFKLATQQKNYGSTNYDIMS